MISFPNVDSLAMLPAMAAAILEGHVTTEGTRGSHMTW